jgi:hypothetical protein
MPSTITRTQALAKAFKGQVIEDLGYRGIIFVPDDQEGKYLRFHPGNGVHLVQRAGSRWKSLQVVLKAEEIDGFLQTRDLLPQLSVPNPADVLARVFGGEVVARFDTGGGVTLVSWGGKQYFLRTSQISGLDFVMYVLSKWRTYKSVWSRRVLFEIITYLPQDFKPTGKDIDTALDSIRKEVKPDDRDQICSDRGRDPGSDEEGGSTVGDPQEVSGDQEAEVGRRS